MTKNLIIISGIIVMVAVAILSLNTDYNQDSNDFRPERGYIPDTENCPRGYFEQADGSCYRPEPVPAPDYR